MLADRLHHRGLGGLVVEEDHVGEGDFEPLGEQLVPSSMLWIVFLLGVIAMPFVLLDLLAITRVSKDC